MPDILSSSLAYLRAPANAVGFAVRRRISWRRGPPVLRDEPKAELFDYLPTSARRAAQRREAELRDRYDLEPLRACSTRGVYRDNLYRLDTLEAAFADLERPEAARLLDIGAKNWCYVFALARFFAPTELNGIEIDGHGVYPDLRSRRDHALAYVAQCGHADAHYRVGDFLRLDAGTFDVFTWFYPFLTRYALLHWGLPLRCFRPRAMLDHLVEVARPGALCVVVNQTSEEKDVLHGLLRAVPRARIERAIPLRCALVQHYEATQDRWATVVRIGERP